MRIWLPIISSAEYRSCRGDCKSDNPGTDEGQSNRTSRFWSRAVQSLAVMARDVGRGEKNALGNGQLLAIGAALGQRSG